MAAKKPLIFIHPLSESLQKLKEVIEEIAEDEGIEIFELDDQAEINQLIPTIGQSLSIFSHPKKCAMTLQPNRKFISKLNSKVILLSKKQIPRKTLDKFSKIGLTDCIVEPVAPKTLLYKVKLLLRSIVVKDEEDEEEYDTKFSNEEEKENLNEQQRVEKGVIAEEEDNTIDMNLKGQIQGFELSQDEDADDKKRDYKEESIDTDWKGKVDNNNLAFDNEEDSKKNKDNEEQENYIDSYLRSKKSGMGDLSFDEESNTQKTRNDSDSYEDYDEDDRKKKNSLDLNFDEDIYAKNSEDKEEQVTNDDKYYKSQSNNLDLDIEADKDQNDLATMEDEEEDEERNKNRSESYDLDLDAEENTDNSHDDEEDYLEDEKKRHKSQVLDLDISADKNARDLEEDLEEDKKAAKSHSNEALDLEAETKKKKAIDNGLDFEAQENENDHDSDEEISESAHWKGKVAKTINLIEEDEIDTRSEDELNDHDDSGKNRENNETTLDMDADEDKKNALTNEIDLDFAKDQDEEEELSADIEADEDDKGYRNTEIDLETDSENLENDEEALDLNDDGNYRQNKDKELDLDFDKDEEDQEFDQDDNELDYARRKAGTELDLDTNYENKKHSAHTDNIETNLDSRKGIKHQDQDWDIVNKKDKDEHNDEEKKKKGDLEITFAEKIDLGEQTIDYRKLKNEFDAITINRVGNKRKRKGPKYVSGDDTKDFLSHTYTGEYEEGAEAIANEMSDEDTYNDDKYFEPKSNGIESAVRVLNLYHNKDTKKEHIYNFIASEVHSQFKGKVFFFTFSQESKAYLATHEYKFLESEEAESEFWKEFSSENKEFWDGHMLPHWHDENFSTDKNQFFYPLTEGKLKFGYAICIFEEQIKPDQVKSVEVIIETMRGVVLSEYREKGLKGEYDSSTPQESNKKSGGFFKKVLSIFKRAS